MTAARRDREEHDEDPESDEPDPGAVEIISPGAALDIRFGDYREALLEIGMVDAVISDPPYGKRTHESEATRDDGYGADGLAPDYEHWSHDDVTSYVDYWAPRCRGWMVSLTSDDLIPSWRAAYEAHDRFAFAPVPCVIMGMSNRQQGDGPSSWSVYAMVSRPRNLVRWRTLPGAYVGPRMPGAKSGRGKPSWLMEAIVGDYSNAGDYVVDPMAGWGETLLAALKLGRRTTGAEINHDARREAIRRWHERRNAAPEAAAS